MPLRQMPNGAYVNVPDDVTPQGMQSIMARFKVAADVNTPGMPEPRMSQRDAEDAVYRDKAVTDLKKGHGDPVMGHISRTADSITHAATFGVDDVLSSGLDAATSGVIDAVKKRDISEVGRRYNNNRQALKTYRQGLSEDHPLDDLAGTVVGIVKSPLGAETGVGKLANTAAKYSPKVAEGLKALKATRATKVGNSAPGVAARAGFNQGVVTGAMDGKSPEDILNEGGQNALWGAAAGTLLHGAGGAYKIIKDRAPASAERVAHERIAKILQGSEDGLTGKPFTPNSIENEIRATNARGGSASLADLMPETQSLKADLVRRGVAGANHAANNAEDRAMSALDRWDAKVRKTLKIDKGSDDAYAHGKRITADRKAAGAADFGPDVMDAQLRWNDDLDKVFQHPYVKKVLPGAEELTRADGKDLTQMALPKNPKDAMRKVPSMHVMDNVKDALNDRIGEAVRSGRMNDARVHSKILRELKDNIATENGEWGAAIAKQRDFFEQAQSTELGQKVISKLTSKDPNAARELMDLVKAAEKHPDDLKIGLADGLMHTGDNPVAVMRRAMNHPEKRAVLAKLFGSNKELNEFEIFMRRETRAARTDKLVRAAHGNPSVKPEPTNDAGALVDAGLGIARGGVFGPLSAVSALARSGKEAKKLSGSLSPAAQAELLKILESDGKKLKSGIERSKAYKAIQARRMRKAAVVAGKLPHAVVGNYSEQ